MRRIGLAVVLSLGLTLAPLAIGAPPAGKVYRIGLLGLSSRSDITGLAALRQGLRDLGYEEGKNLVIEYRWAEGRYDRLPGFADELVRLKVDVLVTYATPGARAAKRATTTIPVVVALMGDAVAMGIVPSLARPGGNITGSQFHLPSNSASKWKRPAGGAAGRCLSHAFVGIRESRDHRGCGPSCRVPDPSLA
jgi:putative tryptophan/tyrosine transport system substrate-binding protein